MPRRKRHRRRYDNPIIVVLPDVLEPAREVEASGQSLTIRVLNPHQNQQMPPPNHQELKKVPPSECSSTHPEDEDVLYLYSVSKRSLVEMVDLAEDGTEMAPPNHQELKVPPPEYSTHPEDEDVLYLYRVCKKSLVEIVDLVDRAEVAEEGARKFVASGQDFPVEIDSNTTAVLRDFGNREISVTCKAGISIAIGGNPVSAAPILSRKRKRSPSSHATCCTVCQVDYELATNSGNELFHARCGHLFCKQCLQNLSNCIQCKSKIANLWKIYF